MKTEPAATVTYDNNVNFGSPAPRKTDISDAYFAVSNFFILIYYSREYAKQNKELLYQGSKINQLWLKLYLYQSQLKDRSKMTLEHTVKQFSNTNINKTR